MSHVDLLVAQTRLGPAGPGLRGEGGDGAVTAAARLHGGQVDIVISLSEGLLLLVVPVDDIEVSSSGPGPPPPVSLLMMSSVLSVRPDPLLS